MEYKDIILDKQPPIAYITLNRPEKLNTLGRNLQSELNDAVLDIWDDTNIRVYVIKGAGRCFSAGFDLSGDDRPDETRPEELSDDTPAGIKQKRSKEAVFMSLERIGYKRAPAVDWTGNIWNNPKVSIAQVHGYCLGAGLGLTNVCDLVVCSEDTLFAYPPVRFGSNLNYAFLAPWYLSVRKIKEMAYTGNMIDSHDAYYCGLVNRVVPIDQLEAEVNRLARVISRIPYPANELSKIVINNHIDDVLGRTSGLKYTGALNAVIEASSIPGNIWTNIPQAAASKGGAGNMFAEIREKFKEGDTLAIENSKKFSQKKEGKEG